MAFEDGGRPVEGIRRVGDSDEHGTTVTFWPDGTIMEELEFRAQTLIERLREMAFLTRGLEIVFRDERPDEPIEQTFCYQGGISDFVRHLNASKEPLHDLVISYREDVGEGEVEAALQWNTGYYEGIHSFANNIATTEGGMHEEGFKKALTNVLKKYAREQGVLEGEGRQLEGEDIREGLTAIISVKLRNPQFEGQTKTKLGNTEMRSIVEKATNDLLGQWFEEHPNEGRVIVQKSMQAARARQAARQARELTRRKSLLESAGLPGKLADCASREPGRVRAVHRGGRLGRWLGQARPQPGVPGHPPDPRQDPQRRARPHRQDAPERGDPGPHHRDRGRRRRRSSTSPRPGTTRSSS